jgi:hypothetical protein
MNTVKKQKGSKSQRYHGAPGQNVYQPGRYDVFNSNGELVGSLLSEAVGFREKPNWTLYKYGWNAATQKPLPMPVRTNLDSFKKAKQFAIDHDFTELEPRERPLGKQSKSKKSFTPRTFRSRGF